MATDTQRRFVAIEASSDLCRGQSVVDHLQITGREPNAELVTEASREKFLHMLFDAVCRTLNTCVESIWERKSSGLGRQGKRGD